MNITFEQAAQILALAAPVLTLLAMNVALALGGERGTLLLPTEGAHDAGFRPFAGNLVPASSSGSAAPAGTPANDPHYRHAA